MVPPPPLRTPSPASEACGQRVQANLTWSRFGKRLANSPKAQWGLLPLRVTAELPVALTAASIRTRLCSAASKRPRASSRSTLCSSSDLRSRASVVSRRACSCGEQQPTSPRLSSPPGSGGEGGLPRAASRALLRFSPLPPRAGAGGRLSHPDPVPSACGWLGRGSPGQACGHPC